MTSHQTGVCWIESSAFDAAVELWIASRTDADLRRQLRRAEREVMKTIAREAEAALGERARRADFGEYLSFALATIRGLALLRISEGGSSKAVDALWEHARERLRRMLD